MLAGERGRAGEGELGQAGVDPGPRAVRGPLRGNRGSPGLATLAPIPCPCPCPHLASCTPSWLLLVFLPLGLSPARLPGSGAVPGSVLPLAATTSQFPGSLWSSGYGTAVSHSKLHLTTMECFKNQVFRNIFCDKALYTFESSRILIKSLETLQRGLLPPMPCYFLWLCDKFLEIFCLYVLQKEGRYSDGLPLVGGGYRGRHITT